MFVVCQGKSPLKKNRLSLLFHNGIFEAGVSKIVVVGSAQDPVPPHVL